MINHPPYLRLSLHLHFLHLSLINLFRDRALAWENPLSDFATLIFEKSDGLAYITLNRPQVLNIFNIQMRDDLFEVLTAIRDDPEVKVVILKGAGEKAFCAGADLSEFLTAPAPISARQARWFRDLWGLFANLPQPLLAALHGYVLGSGIEMALFCDIRIASDSTRFGLPEVALGIIPAAGGTQTLSRVVGLGKALELLLTNRWIDGQEAYELGLVNKVVPQKELLPTIEEMAQKIAGYRSTVVQSAKQAVSRGLDLSLPEALDLEKRLASIIVSRHVPMKGWK